MNILKRNLLFVLSLAIVFSCGGNSNSEGTKEQAFNYKLEIFDSLQFDILTQSLWIADLDSKTGDMLVFQPRPPKAWLFDKSNELLIEFERPNGDPEGTGEYIFTGTFFEDGIALMGHATVNLYDRQFNFKKSMRPHYGPSQLLMPGYKHMYNFEDDMGSQMLVTYFGQPQTSLWGGMPDYYDEFNVVDVVNPAESHATRDTVFQAIGELTPDSRYRAGKAFYMLQTRFNVSENKLYHIFNDDTTLFIRNLPQGDIIDSYKVPFDKFILFEGYSMGRDGIAEQYQRRNRPGRVESVYHTGDFEVIVYHSGMNTSEIEQYDRESPDFYDLLEKADFKKYLIVKDGKRVNRNLKLDSRVYYLEFVDDEGIFYGMQDSRVPEEEPEFFTIYKLRIVSDEN